MRQVQNFVKLRVNFLNDGALSVFVNFGKFKKSGYHFFLVNSNSAGSGEAFADIISKRVVLRKFFSIAQLLERCNKNGLID